MGRLIDADALYEKLQNDSTYDLGCMDSELREIIERQPTAYDVEKVVEQVESALPSLIYGSGYNINTKTKNLIDIVKKGGVE